jgi:glycosyltransferase involved in cell wall biosynthesis
MKPMNAIVSGREMGMAPRVSVVAIFLNEARYLSEAIDSVLAQDCDCELIMVDDGSTDGSSEIAQDYARRFPNRCIYVEHPGHGNRGASASRNAGVRVARAPYVAFLDGDDVWPRGKLREQVAVLEAHPEVGMVAGAARYWQSWGGGEDRIVAAGHLLDQVIPPGQATLGVYPLGTAQAPCPSLLLLRREVLECVGGFEDRFTGSLQIYEDQVFLTKVYLETSVWFSSRCWLFYRQHAASCMAESERSGTYHEARERFLHWLEGYLVVRGVNDRAIWAAFRRAQFRYRHPQAFAMRQRAQEALEQLQCGARRLVVHAVGRSAIERTRTLAHAVANITRQ